MTITETTQPTTPGPIRAGTIDLWVDRRGTGPDVLLIAGLGDTVEAWEPQLYGLSDRYRLTGFDNRGAGRSPGLPTGFTVADMADDAAELLHALGIRPAHVMGFSGGSAIAQELALRHPEAVRSLVLVSTWARADAYFNAMVDGWSRVVDHAPDERAMLEDFYFWIYTARAHNDGTVGAIVDEVLAFPHGQSAEAFQAQLEAFRHHDTLERLPRISAPTLVVAGGVDMATPSRYGRAVADAIPGARFQLLHTEAHQPFQEIPDDFNGIVDAFWSELDEAT